MIETISLFPGVELHCYTDSRFKQGALSLQLVRPMQESEAAMNALLPAVWLRGSEKYPDLRAITLRLDDLYGAGISALVRRVGDWQTTGFYCSFIEDRFAMDGDAILAPMVEFVKELLLEPLSDGKKFNSEFVAGEKKNLISTIESERNDKRAYAATRLLQTMCAGDSFAIPRLGSVSQAKAIRNDRLFRHYKKLLRESPVQLFYVGSAQSAQVASLLRGIFADLERAPIALSAQTPFCDAGGKVTEEQLDIAQSQLCMGFTTPVTGKSEEFAAMQVFNTIFGAGMTSKLFMNVREKLSLCYSVGSGYYSTKGIVTVSAGIDAEKKEVAREEILHQLALCKQGEITAQELEAGKQALLSGLRGIHDSPGAIESYYSTGILSGNLRLPAQYRQEVEQVTVEAVAAAAQSVTLHSEYFLKGVGA